MGRWNRIPSVSAAVLERSGPIPQNAPISGAQSAVAMDSNISAFCEFTGSVSLTFFPNSKTFLEMGIRFSMNSSISDRWRYSYWRSLIGHLSDHVHVELLYIVIDVAVELIKFLVDALSSFFPFSFIFLGQVGQEKGALRQWGEQREVFCGDQLEGADAAYWSHGYPPATMCHCVFWAHAQFLHPPTSGYFELPKIMITPLSCVWCWSFCRCVKPHLALVLLIQDRFTDALRSWTQASHLESWKTGQPLC